MYRNLSEVTNARNASPDSADNIAAWFTIRPPYEKVIYKHVYEAGDKGGQLTLVEKGTLHTICTRSTACEVPASTLLVRLNTALSTFSIAAGPSILGARSVLHRQGLGGGIACIWTTTITPVEVSVSFW